MCMCAFSFRRPVHEEILTAPYIMPAWIDNIHQKTSLILSPSVEELHVIRKPEIMVILNNFGIFGLDCNL